MSLQTWILEASPKATEAATSLFVATFNLSIALGGLIGGLTLDAVATVGVLWVGRPRPSHRGGGVEREEDVTA